jgi:hypothetical protein
MEAPGKLANIRFCKRCLLPILNTAEADFPAFLDIAGNTPYRIQQM